MAAGREDADDLLQVAWLYHVGQLSQKEVSRRLGMSRFKVLRLLAEARDLGLVRVSVEHRATSTLELADRVAARFRLTEVQVAPAPADADDDHARRAVGIVAAGLLTRIGAAGAKTIGVGWGRTVAAMSEALTGLRNPQLRFVSPMGTLTRVSGTGPFDLATRLATTTGGTALVLPAPFICDSKEDAQVILRQRLVRETLEVARRADHAILSLGECRPGALLLTSGVLTPAEADRLRTDGVVADTTGKFLCADGSLAETDLNRRTPSVSWEDLRAMDVMLLAAGAGKVEATSAVLKSGLVDRLVLDERLARALLGTR
jgi:DNA-binding transcriptional regulator LsrR (DeoR family)